MIRFRRPSAPRTQGSPSLEKGDEAALQQTQVKSGPGARTPETDDKGPERSSDVFVDGSKDVSRASSDTNGPPVRRRRRSAGTRAALTGAKPRVGKALKKAVVGAMMGLALLSPLQAQAQSSPDVAGPPPVEQVVTAPEARAGPTMSVFDAMLSRGDSTEVTTEGADPSGPAADDGAGVHVETTVENDNLPPQLGGLIDEGQRFGAYGDDDGMTARQRLEVAITSPADEGGTQKQVVGWASWRMLTERRLDDGGGLKADYDHRRSDEISAGVQLNTRAPITDDGAVHLVYGLGGGVQLHGPLGLDQLQDWFHTLPMGGRHLPDSHRGSTRSELQHNYTSDVGVSGLLTGGVQLVAQPFANELLTLKAGAQTRIPLGTGSLTVQAGAGFELQPLPSVELSGGVRAHGQYVMGEHLDFFADEDLKNFGLGADVGLRLDLEELAGLKTGVIAQVHFNDLAGSGMFGESTTYSVGLSIPLGDASWLSPTK